MAPGGGSSCPSCGVGSAAGGLGGAGAGAPLGVPLCGVASALCSDLGLPLLSVRPPACPSARLSVCPSVRLSVRPSAPLAALSLWWGAPGEEQPVRHDGDLLGVLVSPAATRTRRMGAAELPVPSHPETLQGESWKRGGRRHQQAPRAAALAQQKQIFSWPGPLPQPWALPVPRGCWKPAGSAPCPSAPLQTQLLVNHGWGAAGWKPGGRALRLFFP